MNESERKVKGVCVVLHMMPHSGGLSLSPVHGLCRAATPLTSIVFSLLRLRGQPMEHKYISEGPIAASRKKKIVFFIDTLNHSRVTYGGYYRSAPHNRRGDRAASMTTNDPEK